MQADRNKENAKEEADKTARLHAQHLARTSETITALERIRALKESWDQYAKQAVSPVQAMSLAAGVPINALCTTVYSMWQFMSTLDILMKCHSGGAGHTGRRGH